MGWIDTIGSWFIREKPRADRAYQPSIGSNDGGRDLEARVLRSKVIPEVRTVDSNPAISASKPPTFKGTAGAVKKATEIARSRTTPDDIIANPVNTVPTGGPPQPPPAVLKPNWWKRLTHTARTITTDAAAGEAAAAEGTTAAGALGKAAPVVHALIATVAAQQNATAAESNANPLAANAHERSKEKQKAFLGTFTALFAGFSDSVESINPGTVIGKKAASYITGYTFPSTEEVAKQAADMAVNYAHADSNKASTSETLQAFAKKRFPELADKTTGEINVNDGKILGQLAMKLENHRIAHAEIQQQYETGDSSAATDKAAQTARTEVITTRQAQRQLQEHINALSQEQAPQKRAEQLAAAERGKTAVTMPAQQPQELPHQLPPPASLPAVTARGAQGMNK